MSIFIIHVQWVSPRGAIFSPGRISHPMHLDNMASVEFEPSVKIKLSNDSLI